MISEKKYVYSCIGIVALLLLCVASFNYWQDPAEVFSGEERYQEASKGLAKGRTVAVTRNYDERLLKASVIKQLSAGRNVVVIGSSRVMGIGNEFMTGKQQVLNLAVSGAVLQDDIALWYLLQQEKITDVKTVIVGLDPWLLNRFNGEKRWQSISKAYHAALKEWGEYVEEERNYENWAQLLSLAYTKESWKQWKNKEQPLRVLEEGEEILDGWSLVCPDGSRIWSKKTNNLDVDAEAKKYVADKVYQSEGFEKLDDDLCSMFSLWIEDMQRKGIKVVFYFPPYHPYVYDYLRASPKYASIFAAQEYFMEYASTHHISVLGSYNPREMQIDGEMFMDGMHLRREVLTKWLSEFWKIR